LFRLVLESHDGRAPGADSEEKHEPVSDIETVVVDSLKALDPEWPIREADPASLFDNRVGEGKQLFGYREAERLGGRQVNDQIELSRLLDWNVAGLGSA
jgi:hypothetical protein